MKIYTPRPSAPENTLLRAIEEAHFHQTPGVQQNQRYRTPIMKAREEHREMLARTMVDPNFIQFCRGPAPWSVIWAKIAPLIGQPEDLGKRTTSGRVITAVLRKKLAAAVEEES